jgi:hypothetical protein
MEPLSPELALVDPELGAAARARLPDAPWELFAPPRRAVPASAPPVAAPEPRVRIGSSLALVLLAAAVGTVLALVETDGTERPWLAAPQPRAAPSSPGEPIPSPEPAPAPAPPVGGAGGARPADAAPRLRPERAPVPTQPDAGAAPRGTISAPTPPQASAPAPKPPTAPARTTPGAAPPRPDAAGKPATAPARTFAWPPHPKATYYDVQFFRDGGRFFRAQPRQARVELPAALALTPGTYRWVVRPGAGAPAARRLGKPIVDSTFTVG